MAWVTWQQHRAQLFVGLVLLAALGLAALGTHIPISAAYRRDALSDCLPPSARAGCDLIVARFQQEFGAWATAVRGLGVLPALAGLFVGAPLFAREFEQGTYRVAWTQGVTRRGWLLSKSALLALATIVVGGLASLLVMWWREPFDALQGRMAPNAFDVEGLVVPAYAVFALTVGVLAGLLLRRTVPAMTATLVVFVATRLIVLVFLRPNLMPPHHQTALPSETVRRAGDWVLSDTLVDAGGKQVSATREGLAILHAHQASIDPQTYLVSLGWKRLISYQPANRFWTFQMLEGGLFLTLSAAIMALALWLIRRTPA
jgi:ABC-type transport system involved in multi-copper enzyme maturation permease subunit